VDLRHEDLRQRQAQLTPTPAHVIADRPLGHFDAVLVDQPPPHPLGRVTLLARRLAVGGKPPVDQLAVLTKPRRQPRSRRSLGRRNRRLERLAHRAAMHTMALDQRTDRQALTLTNSSDLLEQLHSGSHFLPAPDPRSMSARSSADDRTGAAS